MNLRRPSKGWILLGLFLSAGCSLFTPDPPPLFPVDLCLRSAPDAQLYRGKVTTLYVRVYPLDLADAFNSTDVGQLLADPAPQLAGAAGLPQSRTLSPGGEAKLVFEAPAGAPYGSIGIVAGYYDLKGLAKKVVKTEELRTGSCYTVEFGPSGITGGAPAPTPVEEE